MKSGLIEQVAWVGKSDLRKPIRGIVLRFSGLGGTTALKNCADAQELEWADAGALVVHPYHNPWAWMNGPTVRFLDELMQAIYEKYALKASVPVIATGGSMGGHAALTYTLKSKRRVNACYANCPVCDLEFHYSERTDLPRTFHSAFDNYGDIRKSLKEYSPLHQAAKMPKVKYFIIHGLKDSAVSKVNHSDKMVKQLKKRGYDITYLEEAEMGHCNPMSYETYRASTDFVKSILLK